eukprot:377280_1
MYSAALMIMYIVSVFTNIPWTQQCTTTTKDDPISVLETMDLNVPNNGAFNMVMMAAFSMAMVSNSESPSITNSFSFIIYSIAVYAPSLNSAETSYENAMCTGSMCALYNDVVECYSKSSLFSPSANPTPIFKESYTDSESGDSVKFYDVAINPIDGVIYVIYDLDCDSVCANKLG